MNLFILRWNPNISSYKKENHLEIVEHIKNNELPDTFDWSVREHEKLQKDDMFILQQVGTQNDGIAMIGKFKGDCQADESWRKDGTNDFYAGMWIMDAFDCDTNNPLPASRYETLFPQIEWHGGHSGLVVAEELDDKLINQIEKDLIEAQIWQQGELDKFMSWDFNKETSDGQIILRAKEFYLKDRSQDAFINFIGNLINRKVLIPMHVEQDEEGKDRCFPLFLSNENGKIAYPIFSTEEQIGTNYQDDDCEFYEIPVPLAINIIQDDQESNGLILDPFTTPFLLDKELCTLILQLDEQNTPTGPID